MINTSLPTTQTVNPVALNLKRQYSRKEAADILSIPLHAIDNLIVDKEIAVRRAERRVLISGRALAQFMKRDHQTEAEAQ